MRWKPATLLLLGMLAFASCERLPRRQVVLITLDTLRADALGCYGAGSEASPQMDAFARRSVLFRQATCQATWTTGSVASMMTGRYASEVLAGARTHAWTVHGGRPTLAEQVRRSGLRTVAVVSNPRLHGDLGYDRGFDDYLELFTEQGREHAGLDASITGRPPVKIDGASVTRAALRALPALENRDFLLWVHYMDPHTPYLRRADRYYRRVDLLGTRERPGEVLQLGLEQGHRGYAVTPPQKAGSPPDSGEQGSGETPAPPRARQVPEGLLEAYAGEVRYVDERVGGLLRGLDRHGLLDSALIILHSDHGESLFDHEGYFGHGDYPYQATAHVPLMIRWPGEAPGVVDEPVALLDLAPTVLRHARAPLPDGMRGARLSPDGRIGSEPILIETLGWDHRAIRAGVHKLIRWGDRRGSGSSLFDVVQDPRELEPAAPRDEQRAQELLHDLERAFDRLVPAPRDQAAPPVDPEIRRQIRALGYVD